MINNINNIQQQKKKIEKNLIILLNNSHNLTNNNDLYELFTKYRLLFTFILIILLDISFSIA